MKPPQYVKFTGKFKNLIPLGFEFQKSFASNYRNYTLKTALPTSEWIVIWQHCGGYVEFDNCQHFSYLILNAIKNGEHKNWKRHYYALWDQYADNFVFYINENDGTFIHGNDDNITECPELIYSKMFMTDKDAALEYRRQYRTVHLSPNMINTIEQLFNDGMIELSDDIDRLWRD